MKRCIPVMIALLLPLAGCSGERDADDHAWKGQERAIDKARQAEEQIRQAFERRRREADD
ncbi:MAG: hypothetical protein Kow006_29970 [Gammaproteobacteria bacterium]